MDVWEKITGNDLTREWTGFEARASRLPGEYHGAWGQVITHLLPFGDFSGRNLTPLLDGVLGLLEESAADGARTFHDRWRDQLNRAVAKKLGTTGA